MHEYEPIRIRPLTLRGVFGITGKVFGRRLGALIGYNCLYLVVLLLIVGIAMLPMLQPLFSLPDYQTSNAEALRIVGGSLMTVMLALLGSLLLSLLIQPIYCGTLYGELSARIYGSASSVGLMLRRSKFSLKRFFTTTLCYLLAAFAIAFVLNIFVSIFTAFATLFATLGSIPSLLNGSVFHAGAGLIVPLVLVFLLVFVAELAGTSFLLFVYPVAVNEPIRNFAAVKRSFQLVWKRFGRVFGCLLILSGIALVFALIFAACMFFAITLSGVAGIVLICLAVLLYLVMLLFLSPYEAALVTVLYFDTRTRMEGTAWLGEPQQPSAQPQQPEPAAWQEPVQEPAPQPENDSPEA